MGETSIIAVLAVSTTMQQQTIQVQNPMQPYMHLHLTKYTLVYLLSRAANNESMKLQVDNKILRKWGLATPPSMEEARQTLQKIVDEANINESGSEGESGSEDENGSEYKSESEACEITPEDRINEARARTDELHQRRILKIIRKHGSNWENAYKQVLENDPIRHVVFSENIKNITDYVDVRSKKSNQKSINTHRDILHMFSWYDTPTLWLRGLEFKVAGQWIPFLLDIPELKKQTQKNILTYFKNKDPDREIDVAEEINTLKNRRMLSSYETLLSLGYETIRVKGPLEYVKEVVKESKEPPKIDDDEMDAAAHIRTFASLMFERPDTTPLAVAVLKDLKQALEQPSEQRPVHGLWNQLANGTYKLWNQEHYVDTSEGVKRAKEYIEYSKELLNCCSTSDFKW